MHLTRDISTAYVIVIIRCDFWQLWISIDIGLIFIADTFYNVGNEFSPDNVDH